MSTIANIKKCITSSVTWSLLIANSLPKELDDIISRLFEKIKRQIFVSCLYLRIRIEEQKNRP